MLIDDLIRVGRPLLKSEDFAPEDVLRLITGIEDERAKNFYQHVFVVEVPTDEGQPPRVLPIQQFGEMVRVEGKEKFEVALSQAEGAPFVLPSGGNPVHPQGRYLPVYPCYERHILDFRESAQAVKQFLTGRLERTVGFSLSNNMVDAIASALHEALRIAKIGDEKKALGVLILARVEPGGYYTTQQGVSPHCIGKTADGLSIVPNFARILEGFWEAKHAEGKEAGSRAGLCSFSGNEGELVSAYCKAWPWAFPTWSCPLPLGGDERMMVESVALGPETYRALTLGACVFNRLTRPVDRLQVLPELFSPADTRAGKDQAQRRRELTAINGSGLLLPIQDKDLANPEGRRVFVEGIRFMLDHKDQRRDQTMADRYITAVTGFDMMLPRGLDQQGYRLTLIYFSGESSRGDVHLRAYIQDVVPSTLALLRDLARSEAKRAMELLRVLGKSEKQIPYYSGRYQSIPYLLARAYGGAYLWQQLEHVLHRKRLDPRRAIANAARRMQSLTPRWPDSRLDLFEEVGFYLSFLQVLSRANRELAGFHEESPVRPWKELLDTIDKSPVGELQLAEPAEIGFACGALIKRFSGSYYMAKKSTKANADFVRDQMMTFGSDLRVADIHDKGLRSILELPNKLPSLKHNRDLAERAGAMIAAFQQNREPILRDKDSFLAAFWAGFALEGHDRPRKPKICPHCGKALEREAAAAI
jgi:hypothetical protein